MADPSAALSKREFLEMSCLILGEILSPQMLRPALEAAAAKLAIPDGASLVAGLLAEKLPVAAKGKAAKKVADSENKEKKTRSLTTYNAFITWFSDFASNYGHHPAIVKLKAANPTLKAGVAMASEFYKTSSEDAKTEMKNAVDPFLKTFSAEHPGEGAMAAVKAYEAAHPDKSFSKLLKLNPKAEYKTDPAAMKAEAAEARKAADGGAPSGAAPTPGPAVTPAAKTEEDKKDKKRKKEKEGEGEGEEEEQQKKKKEKGEKSVKKEKKEKGEKSEKKEKKEKK